MHKAQRSLGCFPFLGGVFISVDDIVFCCFIICGSYLLNSCFAMLYIVYLLVCNHLGCEQRAVFFTVIILPMSYDCQFSVAFSQGTVDWSQCVIVV